MVYLVRRLSDGERDMRGRIYLGADPGRTGDSYVRKIEDAKRFASREEAQRECCENERVQEVGPN